MIGGEEEGEEGITEEGKRGQREAVDKREGRWKRGDRDERRSRRQKGRAKRSGEIMYCRLINVKGAES